MICERSKESVKDWATVSLLVARDSFQQPSLGGTTTVVNIM